MRRPRVALITFGCRVNQYDTDAMRFLLESSCELVEEGEVDVYIVNGCSVTSLAEKKARQALHRLRASSPEALILITGCLGEAMSRGMTRIEGADAVAGVGWRSRIPDAVAQALAGRRGRLDVVDLPSLDDEASAGPRDRIRAFLKVQDGCSGTCSYCRAVQLRGAPRSKSLRAAVLEAQQLLDHGFPEIVLTGVSLAEYAAPDGGLPALARSLLKLTGLVRLRVASANVTGITDDLLDVFVNDSRFAPHFHLPLQSGDDRVLHSMRRPYTISSFRSAVARISNRLPYATFGTDIIVGFPGETDAAFDATCRAVDDIGFANLHVFRYSARPGTEAARLAPIVPESVKRDRAERLSLLGNAVRRRALDARLGGIEDVLVEGQRGGRWSGHTGTYLEAVFASDDPVCVGTLCRVRITGASERGLEGVHDGPHRAD